MAPVCTPVPGADGPPADTDGDRLDDVNGNGRIDVAGVVWRFDRL
jgi:hypothetical protein